MTFANAGHPPPYRNGEEIHLDASFPLGITREVEYAETTVWLDRGDRVTFLSDGVLEARSETGGIFGFDRTREISRQSAQAIAKAAQQFGQEDDITVLTLSFSQRDLVIAQAGTGLL
jgi:sigma-B regulation protein RsbU (phosphoserine phosphatase)